MENMRRDITEIKESLGRLDERTVDLPKILRHLTGDTSSLKAKAKFHFWILGILVIVIGSLVKSIYL